MRAVLAEFGVVIAPSAGRLMAELPRLTKDLRLRDPVQALLLEVRELLAGIQARAGAL
jgi:hypothetical protein